MPKIRIGLVSEDKNLENDLKQASESMGGAYVYSSKNILELIQKTAMQKVDLVVLNLPASGDGSDFGAVYAFIRGKKDLHKTPICVLSEKEQFEVNFLLTDVSVRGFPRSGGAFIPLLSMAPLVEAQGSPDGALTENWIQKEFLQSLQANVGQGVHFQLREATEDERRGGFFCQQSEEVRTHLGWFKFTARLLETADAGISRLFQGMNRDTIEEVSQVLINKVTDDFKRKVISDFSTRGAVYLPPKEKMALPDMKWVNSNTKYKGLLYEATECQVLLEIGQSI
ncbi:MAG: hypothetical protein ACAH59_07690 [Pseudobdellovibrionaceae bacterium]